MWWMATRRPDMARALWVAVLATLLLSGCQIEGFGPPPDATGPVVRDQATQIALAPAQLPRTGGTQRLLPGDRINVFVFENPELSRDATIGPDGTFRYPLIGEVRAAGRTLRDLEATIRAGLTRNIVDPQVSVSLVQVRGYEIFVDGEVMQPGIFEIEAPVTLVQAVAMAGGFTAFARRDRILVYNPSDSERRFVFNYLAFLSAAGSTDIPLRPGDTVIVE